MRIVIISPYQKRLQRGIERFSISLAKELVLSGHTVTIYAWGKIGESSSTSYINGVKIRTVFGSRYYQSFLSGFFYKKWLRKDNPNITVLNFLYQGEIVLPKSRSYYYVLNSPAEQVPTRYVYIKRNRHRFKNMRFIAVSEYVRQGLLAYLPNEDVSVIPNGVDTELFKPKGKVKTISRRVITCSALEERKGIQFFIKAFPLIADIIDEYHIYGAGPYQQNLKDLIIDMNLERRVFIHSPIENIHETVSDFDFFVLLSKGEAFALAPVEAVSAGLPILVANEKPYDEWVDNSFGRMVNRLSNDEIRQAILDIYSSYAIMSENARKASLRFSWKSIANNYLEVFEKTVNS